MSDYPLDPRQRIDDPMEAMQAALDRRQAQIHTAFPGRIISYNAAKATATVQPLIQGVRTKPDGTREGVQIAPIADVPVHFTGGGGYWFTFPVRADDECLLVFSERNIDNWYQHGGSQLPGDWRMHDISDAICLVGSRSQPKVPGATGGSLRSAPGPSGGTVQLRSDDGATLIEMSGAAGVRIATGQKVRMECPRLEVTGEIVAKCDGGSITLSQHTHKQDPDAHGDAELPTKPATPGT
jgi:hypothetical protein